MQQLSVVIITKNEAENIVDAILSAKQITNDIVVADSGSTDGTIEAALKAGARIIQMQWKGFGAVRNEAAQHAQYDWILALDADERIDSVLSRSIQQLSPEELFVYGFPRLNFLYGQPVHYGEWGRDVQYRLYNRKKIKWKEVPVHESLDVDPENKRRLKGKLLHLTMKNAEEYACKVDRYAHLMAEKYFSSKKSAAGLKQWISPVFSFLQNYILRLGFLDGKKGITIASMSAKYSFLKYKYLKVLQQQHKN